jgi:CheY-like chemotaxis protein
MSSATVLIAEDSENDIFLLRGALIKANLTHPIDFVHNGQQAIEYLRTTAI